MLLEICMFAEASKNQEEISVVGPDGKIEAFVPAHQLGGGSGEDQPNIRIGLRRPWKDSIRPPEPGTVVEEYEGGDAAALAAGYHEGATWYVKAFVKVWRAFHLFIVFTRSCLLCYCVTVHASGILYRFYRL
jgi:hypothetical protein